MRTPYMLVLGFGCLWALGACTFPEATEEIDGQSCWTLAHIVGPEDFAIQGQGDRRLLVSSQDRRHGDREGGIYAVDPDRGSSYRLPLRGRDDCSFHPHGIALVDKTSKPRLYVINHHGKEDLAADRGCVPRGPGGFPGPNTSIEIFEVQDGYLQFRQRLTDPEVLTNANDLVADEYGNLYVTVPPVGFAANAAELAGVESWPQGSRVVAYHCQNPQQEGRCNGRWQDLGAVGRYTNGIALASATSELIVASTIDGSLYKLDTTASKAEEADPWREEAIPGADNIQWLGQENRTLLIAAHPELRRYLQHAQSPRATSPSAVWQVSMDGSTAPERIFYDSGDTLSGVSTAACLDGKLILGQVFGDALLQCDAPSVCRTDSSTTPEEEETQEPSDDTRPE